MDNFQFTGLWWLPENPNGAIPGTLTFQGDDNARLSLIGSFRDLSAIHEAFQPPLIHGITATGKQIALYLCSEVETKFSSGGFLTSEFAARMVFMGHHFGTPEEMVFRRAAVSYDRLSDWAWLSGFQSSIEPNANSGIPQKYTLEYSYPEPHEININGLVLRFEPTFHGEVALIDHYDLRQEMFIEVEPLIPTSFNGFISNILYHIQNFISLGVGRPVYPRSLNFILSPQAEAPDQTIDAAPVIQVYCPIRRGIPDKPMHPSEMLFSFAAIREQYQQCLEHWFAKAPILKPVYDLYFSTLYGSDMYGESKFLSLAQALETYHRRIFGGNPLPPEQFASLKDALIKVVQGFKLSHDAYMSYMGKLEYMNEFSLRKRVREVLKSCGAPVSILIPNKKAFTDRFVDTRNYLTHYDSRLEAKAVRGNGLYLLTQQVKFLLELCFLKEIGLSEAARTQIMTENQQYIHVKSLLNSDS
jgi:ApeA N-terminal domain 1